MSNNLFRARNDSLAISAFKLVVINLLLTKFTSFPTYYALSKLSMKNVENSITKKC